MPLIYGLLALGLGGSLVCLWWSPAFVASLQVLGVVVLLVFGLIWTVVGYSELKASRELAVATKDGEESPTPDTAASDE